MVYITSIYEEIERRQIDMSKMEQKRMTMISGTVKEVLTSGVVSIDYEKWEKGTNGNPGKFVTKNDIKQLENQALTDNLNAGDYVIFAQYPNGTKDLIRAGEWRDSGSIKNDKGYEQGITIINGQIIYAALKDEAGKIRTDGTPKKPHFDILVKTNDNIVHVIHIYNSGQYHTDDIEIAEKKFKEYVAGAKGRGTFVTELSHNQYTQENGEYTNNYREYFGMLNLKIATNEFMVFKDKEGAAPQQTQKQEQPGDFETAQPDMELPFADTEPPFEEEKDYQPEFA